MIFSTKNNEFAILGNTLDELRGKLISFNDAYEQSTGKLLGSGGVFDILYKNTSKPIITDSLLNDFEAFKDLFNQSSLSAEVLAEELGGVDDRIVNYAKTCKNGELTTKGFSASLEGMTLKAKAGQVALKGLSLVGNALVGIAASFVITGLIKGIDYLINREEKLKESLSDSIDAFKSTTSEIESLDEQVKTLGENIAELQKLKDAGTISIADDEELQKLKEENDELERQIALLQDRQIREAKQVLKDAEKQEDDYVQSRYAPGHHVTPAQELWGGTQAYINAINSSNDALAKEHGERVVDMYEKIQPTLEAYRSLEEAGYTLSESEKEHFAELKKGEDAYLMYVYLTNSTKEAFVALNQEMQKSVMLRHLVMEKGMTEEQAGFVLNNIDPEDYENLYGTEFAPPALTDYATAEEYGKAYAEAWLSGIEDNVQDSTLEKTDLFTNLTTSKDALEDFISAVESASDAYSTLMNPNISSSDILSSILSITEAISEMGGKLNWEFIDKQTNSVELLGDTIDYISEKYTKSALVDAGFGEEFAETLANSIVESQKAARELENVNTQIDSLQTAYDDLTDIVSSYNKTGYITFDQLQTLLELEPQYLACLVDENGQLQLNQQAMAALANQRLNDAETQAVQQAIAELGQLTLQDEKTAVVENAQAFSDAIDDLSGYNTELANTIAEASVAASVIRDLNAAISGAESKDVSDEQINTVLENLETKLQLIANTRDNLANSLGDIVGSSSSKTSSTTKDTKETFDWIETTISRIQRTITNLGKTVSATYRNWSTRNNALAQEMAEVNKEINAQMTAYNAYMAEANKIDLDERYKKLVRDGDYSIAYSDNEKLNEKIDLYKEW